MLCVCCMYCMCVNVHAELAASTSRETASVEHLLIKALSRESFRDLWPVWDRGSQRVCDPTY